MNKIVEKDERATYVENISYSFGYKFITYSLLLDIMYRSFRFDEAPWDLFGIIIISGFIITIYQYNQKILSKMWLKTILLLSVISCIVAVLAVTVLSKF